MTQSEESRRMSACCWQFEEYAKDTASDIDEIDKEMDSKERREPQKNPCAWSKSLLGDPKSFI